MLAVLLPVGEQLLKPFNPIAGPFSFFVAKMAFLNQKLHKIAWRFRVYGGKGVKMLDLGHERKSRRVLYKPIEH